MKDIKAIRKELVAQGWTISDRKAGHSIAYPPDKTKPIVVMAGTPGEGRSIANLIAQLRRSGFIWPPPPKQGGK